MFIMTQSLKMNVYFSSPKVTKFLLKSESPLLEFVHVFPSQHTCNIRGRIKIVYDINT